MKSYHICVLALLVCLAAAYNNNTEFWARQLNTTAHFQAYSGTRTGLLRLSINRLVLPQRHQWHVLHFVWSYGA